LKIGSQAVGLPRKVFPATVILALIIGGYLLLVYTSAYIDYQQVVGAGPCTAAAFPRCYGDLVRLNQIGILGDICIPLLVFSALIGLRVKGAFYVAVLIVDLLMAAHVFLGFL
jgi:hypothetical protein